MAKLNLAIVLIFITVQLRGQEYQVLQVKGEIVRSSDGTILKPGDKISEEEQIQFVTKDAMAAVLSEEKGRYIIKVKSEETDQSDLIYVLKSTISPVRGGMSSRSSGIRNQVDLMLYFQEEPFVWVGDLIRVKIAPSAFRMNDKNYFFLRYTVNEEKINKKLPFEDDILIIDKSLVFTVDGQSFNAADAGNYELFYYRSSHEEATSMAKIDFVLMDIEDVEILYSALVDESEYPFYDVAEILSDLYGKCDPLQLMYNIE